MFHFSVFWMITTFILLTFIFSAQVWQILLKYSYFVEVWRDPILRSPNHTLTVLQLCLDIPWKSQTEKVAILVFSDPHPEVHGHIILLQAYKPHRDWMGKLLCKPPVSWQELVLCSTIRMESEADTVYKPYTVNSPFTIFRSDAIIPVHFWY